jgi:BirA family biotin operon repressor/biotin-[acetyl-CoA-carboxylase] ligase
MQVHRAAEGGVRIAAYDTLGSTNAEALSLARGGEHGPLWVTAQRQTAGRGRRGNAWVSEPGNLYATLLLTESVPPGRAPELCFVAALALHDAVTSLFPPLAGGGMKERVKVKWPNDLLIDGRKLSGILIEAESTGGRGAVAIGIGVNCAHHPDDAARPATSLAACGVAVEPDALLRRLSAAMTNRLAEWDEGRGFAAIRAGWLARAAGLGGDIVVRLPDRELTGQFETLDPSGRLMLRLPGGAVEAITAGEVFAPSLTPTRRTSSVDPGSSPGQALPLSGGGEGRK